MLHTHLCDILHIEFPIIQAPIVPATAPELVAAVSNAGGLGSLGATFLPIEDFRIQLKLVRELTDRPFAVNHVVPLLNEEAFAFTLEARPSIISLALGDPGGLVKRAHDAGILVIHQVHTAQQARQAAERRVDVIIAQGSEAGGMGGTVSALALIPQVVDAVRPIPVVAAGGIADGRGLAAALVLGAQGVNVGTRFVASVEASANDAWKQNILVTESEDVVKVEIWKDIFPPSGSGAYDTFPRAIRTPIIEEWQQRRDDAKREAERLRKELMATLQQGRLYELVPFTGQSAGLIRDILPAGEIVYRIVNEAEEALKQANILLK